MKTQTSFRVVSMTLLTIAALAVVMVVGVACGGEEPTPTAAPALPTSPPPPAPTEAPPAPTEAPPAPTEAPPAPTEEAVIEGPLVSEVPIGRERRARNWDAALEEVFRARRASGSDVTGGLAVVFDAKDCLRCHENAEGVEGQIFYGPGFTAFADDQVWVNEAGESILARPDEGHTLPRDYGFIETHIPEKVGATIYEEGAVPPNVIRQNP